jgi:glutaminyl-peptide cyclotransferase
LSVSAIPLSVTRGLDPRVTKAGAAAPPVTIAGSNPAMTAKKELGRGDWLLGMAAAVVFCLNASTAAAADVNAWNGERALRDIETQLSFGRRAMNTPGHQQTIDFIRRSLARAGIPAVAQQHWTDKAEDGTDLSLTNLIARVAPGNPRRILLGTHYDAIIRAYRDKAAPDAPMPGANNSASGVAVLLETARTLATLPPPPVGIDFVFFDGEEGPKSLGAGDPHWTALGSPYFAAHLGETYPAEKPIAAIVFDMVCARDIVLRPEPNSLAAAPREVARFWRAGQGIAPQAFPTDPTPYPIGDDQVALSQAGIPSLLVIDFDYEPWFNTTKDTPERCSVDSLETVGRTLLSYLYGTP